MSASLVTNSGSRERLKVRTRCGCRPCAAQIRCTVRKDSPAAAAMARPVQWVASPGGSPQVSATTRRTVASAVARLAGLAGLVAQQAVDPRFGEALLPAPHRRPAGPGPPGHLRDLEPVGRVQDDPRPRHMLLRPVAIGQDRRQPLTILSRDKGTDRLCHDPT